MAPCLIRANCCKVPHAQADTENPTIQLSGGSSRFHNRHHVRTRITNRSGGPPFAQHWFARHQGQVHACMHPRVYMSGTDTRTQRERDTEHSGCQPSHCTDKWDEAASTVLTATVLLTPEWVQHIYLQPGAAAQSSARSV